MHQDVDSLGMLVMSGLNCCVEFWTAGGVCECCEAKPGSLCLVLSVPHMGGEVNARISFLMWKLMGAPLGCMNLIGTGQWDKSGGLMLWHYTWRPLGNHTLQKVCDF